jgi:integrase
MLTAKEIAALTEAGRYRDGKIPGLYLQVSLSRAGTIRRSWSLRYKINGLAREMGLGAHPLVTLAEARAVASEKLKVKRSGQDPLLEKAQAAAAAASVRTFDQVAEEFLAHICKQQENTKFPRVTARIWRSTLTRFVLPQIGSLDVRAVHYHHVVSILAPLSLTTRTRNKGGPSVARKLQSRIARILDWAAARGYRDPDLPNPARRELLKDVIGKKLPTRHHAAPPLNEAQELYSRIKGADGSLYRAAELMILCATRVKEALDARWEEVDWEARTWTLPAHRTKMARDHVIPLSDRAISLLEDQHAIRMSDRVFPNTIGVSFSRTCVGPALARIGVGYTLHGWRSCCMDVMSEELGIDSETTEFVLGHVKTGVTGAYRRGSSLARRTRTMQAWADWLNGGAAVSNVVPLRAAE